MNNKYILVTGGLGYIGSHTVLSLLEENKNILIVDNLSNSDIEMLDKIEKISQIKPLFELCDLRDFDRLENVFKKYSIESVIHFAGLKSVDESMKKPLIYYDNNVKGTIHLLTCMQKYHVDKILFSSSATVYGELNEPPFDESMQTQVVNVYGNTKLIIEEMIRDIHRANPSFNAILLRYFNPLGAHKSGLIGEITDEYPANLMPYITKVASGKLEQLSVFGDDYDTKDGTCIRDYIHVEDLAEGHIKALQYLETHQDVFEIVNLGSGTGYTVLEIIKKFEEVNDLKLNYKIASRRAGDAPRSFACIEKAKELFDWVPKKDLADMCKDSWNWEISNAK